MGLEKILFYLFAAVLVFAAVRVVTVRNPVHAALFLVLAFFNSSILWMLLEAEFLAITLVLVYVGAVMVLFLFVVMMLDINVVPVREGFTRYLPLGVAIAAVIAIEMGLVAGSDFFESGAFIQPAAHSGEYSNTKELGRVLYTEYVLPFEIAAVILLVAIVAAISLTLRRRPDTKYQDPSQQVRVRRGDRIRLLKMQPERSGTAPVSPQDGIAPHD